MSEIDLIPASWRAEQRARRALAGCAIVIGGIVAAVIAGRIGLELSTRHAQAELRQLQTLRRDGDRADARLASLTAALAEARRQQAIVATLKGEGLVARVLQPLDRSLGDDIWFDELNYAHPGILPQAGNPAPPPVEASLAIRGKAPDAAAIGQFAEAVGKAGPCAKPKLAPGNVKHYTRFELVEFALACSLKSGPGGDT